MDKVLCRPAPGTNRGRPVASLSNRWRSTGFGGLFRPGHRPGRLRGRMRLCRVEDLRNLRPDTPCSNRLLVPSRGPSPWDLIYLLVA